MMIEFDNFGLVCLLCCMFLKVVGVVVVVSLIIGFDWVGFGCCVFVVIVLVGDFVLNVFLCIMLDGVVMVIVKYVEMG